MLNPFSGPQAELSQVELTQQDRQQMLRLKAGLGDVRNRVQSGELNPFEGEQLAASINSSLEPLQAQQQHAIGLAQASAFAQLARQAAELNIVAHQGQVFNAQNLQPRITTVVNQQTGQPVQMVLDQNGVPQQLFEGGGGGEAQGQAGQWPMVNTLWQNAERMAGDLPPNATAAQIAARDRWVQQRVQQQLQMMSGIVAPQPGRMQGGPQQREMPTWIGTGGGRGILGYPSQQQPMGGETQDLAAPPKEPLPEEQMNPFGEGGGAPPDKNRINQLQAALASLPQNIATEPVRRFLQGELNQLLPQPQAPQAARPGVAPGQNLPFNAAWAGSGPQDWQPDDRFISRAIDDFVSNYRRANENRSPSQSQINQHVQERIAAVRANMPGAAVPEVRDVNDLLFQADMASVNVPGTPGTRGQVLQQWSVPSAGRFHGQWTSAAQTESQAAQQLAVSSGNLRAAVVIGFTSRLLARYGSPAAMPQNVRAQYDRARAMIRTGNFGQPPADQRTGYEFADSLLGPAPGSSTVRPTPAPQRRAPVNYGLANPSGVPY